ncbi:hemagglutinin protein [uncultured Kordia sp.]|uniref:hemagglutinin protein n=1 Tax=uncultured Kordia sp. TaxID=507699 RepID=UPI0026159690|nr:hemagglutinin protein [uncultured Kordia sp.]
MKHYFLFLGIICISFFSQAQDIERQVVASSGETIANGTVSLNFTVGELAVTTITDGNSTLTQGFHQTTILLGIKIDLIVFLQGALLNSSNNLMRDDLRSTLLTTTSPYSDGLTCAASVLNTGGTSGTGMDNDDIVDWVFIELRDAVDNTIVASSQSALLQRDGDIVATDGLSDIEIEVRADDYYVVIKHRSHLGIMTANTVALSGTSATVDFTNATNQITFGSNAQTTFGMPSGIVAMWAGNVNEDAVIQYSGTNPDVPSILSLVLNDAGNFLNLPTYAVLGYNNSDVDMNGTIQYTGTTPDTPFILQNVLAHPENFLNFSTYQIQEQLPEN